MNEKIMDFFTNWCIIKKSYHGGIIRRHVMDAETDAENGQLVVDKFLSMPVHGFLHSPLRNGRRMNEKRENAMTKRSIRMLALLTACMLCLSLAPAVGAEQARPTVRVAFPEQEGMSQVARSGKLSGYNYDYLEKISEFTGWQMEYVPYASEDGNEAVGSALDDLTKGKVDLMGPILKNAATEALFEFPETSYGTVYTTLCADINSSLRKNDLNTTHVLRIGLWETAQTRNQEVTDFLKSEGIQGEIHYYSTYDAQLQALREGKVDVISGLSLSPAANTRILARFAPRPYYFVSTKGNRELIDQLDAAMSKIDELQPELQDSLFDKYFLNSENVFYLTADQREALAPYSKLRVLCVDGDAPYVYRKNGAPAGALVLAVNDFAEAIGLTPEYTFCDSQSEAESALASESYDLLMGMPITSAFCAGNGFIRSETVFSAGMSLLRGTAGSSYSSETLGVVRGLENSFDSAAFRNIVLFDSAEECLAALKSGKINVAAGDRSVMDFYLYEDSTTLATAAISGITHEVCIAVSRAHSQPLLGILNNFINSLSTYQRTVYLDNGSAHSGGVSLVRWVAANPVPAILLVSIITALVAASVLLFLHTAAMRKKDRQLSIAVQAKSNFLSRMSHDIRTPLNGIIGLLKISEEHPTDEALLKENRQKMSIAARHLLSLVNDVLEMGKLEDGVEEIALSPVDLGELARDIEATLRDDAAQAGISVKFEGPQEPVYSNVMGSAVHLRQIFLNIYSNCVKFTDPGGTITTKYECLGLENDVATYRWIISDTGIGMSEEFLKHIFEPFSQEHSGARTEYQGTGLGMSIVKELVSRMGGTIAVTSRKGAGSTFVLTLPFALVKTRNPEKLSIAGYNLLLAEDNPLNAEIAHALLTDRGAKLTVVTDGLQAVELFEKSPVGTFDAILMDIMMPVMDGIEAARTIRAMPRPDGKTIPIIAMTANAFAEDMEKCRAAGMNAHLAKPIEIEKVVAAIAGCCGKAT